MNNNYGYYNDHYNPKRPNAPPKLTAEAIETINRLLGEGKRLEITAKPTGIAVWEIKNKRIEI